MRMMGRNLLALAIAVSFLAAPLARAVADEGMDRVPATAEKHSKKKKAKKKARKHVAKHHSGKAPKSHAPKAAGGASHFPTQPGGSGFADIPNEKKDDLPPPATPPNQ